MVCLQPLLRRYSLSKVRMDSEDIFRSRDDTIDLERGREARSGCGDYPQRGDRARLQM